MASPNACRRGHCELDGPLHLIILVPVQARRITSQEGRVVCFCQCTPGLGRPNGSPTLCPSFPSHPRSAAVIRGAAGHSGCLWQLNSRIQRRYPVHVAVGTQRTIPKPESRARTLSTIQTNIEHNTELVGLNLPSRENGRKGRRKQRMPYAHHSGAKSW